MNSIKLHAIAFIIILPCVFIVSDGSPVINIAGIIYALFLFRLSYTPSGKRFIRNYYREILRLESQLK